MEKMTKQAIQLINAEINEAVKAVAKKHGVTIRTTNSTFDEIGYTTKVEVKIDNPTLTAEKDKKEFELFAYCNDVEFPFGYEFRSNGKTFKVCGINPKSPKYKIRCKCADGKQYKFTTQSINLHFKYDK